MNAQNSAYYWGVFWSFTSAFLWGTTFVGARYLLKDQLIDPISLSMIRFILGSVALFILGCIFFRRKIFSVKSKDLLKLAGLSLLGVVGMSVFLFAGQQFTCAINSSVIVATSPILILLFGFFAGHRVKLNQIAGIFISMFGGLLVVGVINYSGFQYSFNGLKGDILVFMSAASWALYSVLSRPLVTRLGGFTATTWSLLFGALELVLLRLAWPEPMVLPDFDNRSSWLLIVYLGLFPTGLAFFAWYEAMARIELQLLNVMQYLTPVFTIWLACWLLGEGMNLLNVVGIMMVFFGVMITSPPRFGKLFSGYYLKLSAKSNHLLGRLRR